MFLQMCVILFTGGGVSASVHAGIPPPGSRHPPRTDTPPRADTQEQTPPSEQTPPKSRHPPGSRHPLKTRHTPRSRHPPEQTPPQEQTPPSPGSRLRHTVNERPVRIVLECILFLLNKFPNHEILFQSPLL